MDISTYIKSFHTTNLTQQVGEASLVSPSVSVLILFSDIETNKSSACIPEGEVKYINHLLNWISLHYYTFWI